MKTRSGPRRVPPCARWMSAIVAAAILPGAPSVSQWHEFDAVRNDPEIYVTVIDSVVRPELRRLFRVPENRIEPALAVVSRTTPLSDDTVDYLERAPRPGAQPLFAELLSAAERRRLARSLRERNRQEQDVDLQETNLITLAHPDALFAVMQSNPDRFGGFSKFSRPGYEGSHAIVCATYTCGGLCGKGWLILLNREVDRWRVTSAQLIWVS